LLEARITVQPPSPRGQRAMRTFAVVELGFVVVLELVVVVVVVLVCV
jgi:hypothetical protein